PGGLLVRLHRERRGQKAAGVGIVTVHLHGAAHVAQGTALFALGRDRADRHRAFARRSSLFGASGAWALGHARPSARVWRGGALSPTPACRWLPSPEGRRGRTPPSASSSRAPSSSGRC